MLWNKANQILELEAANEVYANTQTLLNEKIGELDAQILLLQTHLDKAEVDRDEARAALEQTQGLLTDLEEDNEQLHKEHDELIDEFYEASEAYKNLSHRYELLELVLKQLHIPVTLPAKKK
jgi:chromosome segregation ATPase